MSKAVFVLLILVCAFSAVAQETKAPGVTQGSLFARGKEGKDLGACPLKNTSVKSRDQRLRRSCPRSAGV